MGLTLHLARHFTPTVRERGLHYFRGRSVFVRAASGTHLEAGVRGGRLYDVSLEVVDEELICSCDCPYQDLCKHIWAALLEAEKRGSLGAAELVRDVVFEDFNIGLAPADFPSAKSYSLWQTQLANLRVFDEPWKRDLVWPASRELWYVIDTGYSRASTRPFTLNTRTREPKKTGGWTKLKDLRLRRADLSRIPNEDDRAILTLLAGSHSVSYHGSLSDEMLGPGYEIHPPLTDTILPMLLATGRLCTGEELTPVVADEGEPWIFELSMQPDRSGNRMLLDGSLTRAGKSCPLSDLRWIGPDGRVLIGNRIARLQSRAAVRWIRQFLASGAIAAPAEEAGDLLAVVLAESEGIPVTVPDAFAYERIAVRPRPSLRFHSQPRTDRVPATLEFLYGDWIVTGGSSASAYEKDKRVLIVRDSAAEQQATQQLRDIGLKLDQSMGQWTLPRSKLAGVATTLMQSGWIVHIEGKPFRQSTGSRMEVTSGIDWFDLGGDVSYGDASAGMPKLLEAIRRGHSVVELDDGSYGVVPEEWLERLGRIAQMGTAAEGSVRFSRAQTGLLDALLAADQTIAFDAGFAQAREQLASFHGIAPATEPATFTGTLRGYQREGLAWMTFLQQFGWGGCLADDMGLGKTAQVLALLEQRRLSQSGPSLVVVPRSLVFNWKAEAARFTPEMRVLDYTGSARSREQFDDYDVVLTTYGTLRRDVPALRERQFDYVVLDEAQAIKNAATDSSKAVRLLRGKHRLAMSGTPIENHLGELWSLFEFLNPGMLGSASAFGAAGSARRDLDPESRQLLARALRPFILRRTKKEVASELPERTEQTLWCELDATGRKLYNELRAHYRDTLLRRVDKQGINKSKMHVLEALLRLRQAACHPGLLDQERRDEPSAKLEILVDQLTEVTEEGSKALVFSQFTTLLGLVRERLDGLGMTYEYLDGATHDRQRPVERFQTDPDCRVFLISLKAGGLGLNLTAAEYVYLLDPWWNPAVEAQAIDRAHRIGQTRPVFAYRLIARETVEEKVLELQKSKRELAAAIISEDSSLVRDLKREDLELLLS